MMYLFADVLRGTIKWVKKKKINIQSQQTGRTKKINDIFFELFSLPRIYLQNTETICGM